MASHPSFTEIFARRRDALTRALAELSDTCAASLEKAGGALADCLQKGGCVFAAGNGGSAADAQHFIAELVGRFEAERQGLRAVSLTTNASSLSAIANDYGYEAVFARQLEALARPGDSVVLVSTSGNSPNILRAAEKARALGVTVIGLTGVGGGALATLCDIHIGAPSGQTATVQEVHIHLLHTLCAWVDERIRINRKGTCFGGECVAK